MRRDEETRISLQSVFAKLPQDNLAAPIGKDSGTASVPTMVQLQIDPIELLLTVQ